MDNEWESYIIGRSPNQLYRGWRIQIAVGAQEWAVSVEKKVHIEDNNSPLREEMDGWEMSIEFQGVSLHKKRIVTDSRREEEGEHIQRAALHEVSIYLMSLSKTLMDTYRRIPAYT